MLKGKSNQTVKQSDSDLWSDEVGGVAWRHEQAVLGSQLFGETKVTDPDGLGVAALVNVQNVAGLQVSVHHLQNEETPGWSPRIAGPDWN